MIALALLSHVCKADQQALGQADLQLKPKLCVISKGEQLCVGDIDIYWQIRKPQMLCLYNKEQQQPLKCWQDKNIGNFLYSVNTDHSLTIELRASQNNAVLASEIFEVIREYVNYRQRRRRPWNFF